jgi:hypothetical protein
MSCIVVSSVKMCSSYFGDRHSCGQEAAVRQRTYVMCGAITEEGEKECIGARVTRSDEFRPTESPTRVPRRRKSRTRCLELQVLVLLLSPTPTTTTTTTTPMSFAARAAQQTLRATARRAPRATTSVTANAARAYSLLTARSATAAKAPRAAATQVCAA